MIQINPTLISAIQRDLSKLLIEGDCLDTLSRLRLMDGGRWGRKKGVRTNHVIMRAERVGWGGIAEHKSPEDLRGMRPPRPLTRQSVIK